MAEYIAELYKSENADLRETIEKYLQNIDVDLGSIRAVTEKIHTGSEKERAQAVHALKLAQAQASHAETVKSRAADDYAARETLREAQLRYNSSQDGYRSNGITAEEAHSNKVKATSWGLGTGAAVGGISGGLAVLAGAVPVAGWIIGAVAGISAAALAIWKLYESYEAGSEVAAQENWALKDDFASLGIDDKINALRASEENLRASIDEGTGATEEQLVATRELREAFEDYRDRLRTQ